jgi:hypothetical protein
MTDDVYSKAIENVCLFYNITREECVEHYWDEVEEMMSVFKMMIEDGEMDE